MNSYHSLDIYQSQGPAKQPVSHDVVGITPVKGDNSKIIMFMFYRFNKQFIIVYIGVIDPAC